MSEVIGQYSVLKPDWIEPSMSWKKSSDTRQKNGEFWGAIQGIGRPHSGMSDEDDGSVMVDVIW